MDQQGLSTKKSPLFTGDNYEHQSVRMKFHLMSLGYKDWRSFEIEYEVPKDVPIDEGKISQYEANEKI